MQEAGPSITTPPPKSGPPINRNMPAGAEPAQSGIDAAAATSSSAVEPIPDQPEPSQGPTTPEAAPEPVRRVEISPERQTYEVNQVAGSLLDRKVASLKKAAESSGVVEDDSDANAVLGVNMFVTSELVIPAEGLPLTPGKEPQVDGLSVVSIQKVEGDDFICICQSADGSTKEDRTIKRQDLLTAYIISEREAIIRSFDGPQRNIMTAYMDNISGRAATLTPEQALALNDTIVEAATAGGLTTADDLRGFVEKTVKEVTIPAEANDEQKAVLEGLRDATHAKREELLAVIEGKNLADPADLRAVVEGAGIPLNKLEATAEETKTQIAKLQKDMSSFAPGMQVNTPQGPGILTAQDVEQFKASYGQQIEFLEMKLEAIEVITRNEDFKKGDPIEIFTAAVASGEISAEVAREYNRLIRTGDVDGLAAKALPDLQEKIGATTTEIQNTKAENQRRREQRERLIKFCQTASKTGLSIAGLILALALLTGSKGPGGGG